MGMTSPIVCQVLSDNLSSSRKIMNTYYEKKVIMKQQPHIKIMHWMLRILQTFIVCSFLANLIFVLFFAPSILNTKIANKPQKTFMQMEVNNKCENIQVKQYIGLSTVDTKGARINEKCS